MLFWSIVFIPIGLIQIAVASGCADRWGFFITENRVTFNDAWEACSRINKHLVPIKVVDDDHDNLDRMNPVLRYMAGRVAEECNVDSFWVDAGLWEGMAVRPIDDDIDIEIAKQRHKALCYDAVIEYPSNVPPAQSVFYRQTVTMTSTRTRTVSIPLVVTQDHPPIDEFSTTEYAKDTITITKTVTDTLTTPEIVRYASLDYETHQTRQLVVSVRPRIVSETHTSTLTTVITYTGTVFTDQHTTVTLPNPACPVKDFYELPIASVGDASGKLESDSVDPKAQTTPEPKNNKKKQQEKRPLVCDRFASIAAIQLCDLSIPENAMYNMLLVQTPLSFMEAECVCGELSMRVAIMDANEKTDTASKLLQACSTGWTDARAWIRQKGACESLPDSGQGAACIDELPVICEPVNV